MKDAMQSNDPQAVAVRVVTITKMIAQARDEMAGKLVAFIAPSTSERYISTDLFVDL